MKTNYDLLIHGLLHRSLAVVQADPAALERWRLHRLPNWVAEVLPTLNPEELISFLRDHQEYGFVYYDAFGKVCGKPREIAAYLLTELLKELVEEKL
jgi:hypothetical protein